MKNEKKLKWIVVTLLSWQLNAASEEKTLEESLSEKDAHISFLRDRVQNFSQLNFHHPSMSKESANELLKHASMAIEAGDYFSATRFLQIYAKENQASDPISTLTLRFGLSSCYFKLKMYEKALENIQLYLAAFLNAPIKSYDQLLLVLGYLVHMDKIFLKKDELRSLLSPLLTLNIKAPIRHEIVFICAKIASKLDLDDLGFAWLNSVHDKEDDPKYLARSHYFAALIALKLNSLKTAQKSLHACLTKNADKNRELSDYAHLVLARIHAHLGELKQALDAYERIEHEPILVRIANYERVFVHLRHKSYEQARTAAMEFLGSYKDDPNSAKLSQLLPYLNIKSDSSDFAQQMIHDQIRTLEAIKNQISSPSLFARKSTLETSLTLYEMTKALIPQPPSALISRRAQEEMREVRDELLNLRGSILRTTKLLANSRLSDIDPRTAIIEKRLLEFASENLSLGSEISWHDRDFNRHQMIPAHLAKISRSYARRSELLSAPAKALRKFKSEGALIDYLALDQQLTQITTEIQELDVIFRSYNFTQSFVDESEKDPNLQTLKSQIFEQTASYGQIATKLLNQKMFALQKASENSSHRKYLNLYAMALSEESQIFLTLHQKNTPLIDDSTTQKFRNLWQKWSQTMVDIYEAIAKKDTQQKNHLQGIANQLEALSSGTSQAQKDLLAIEKTCQDAGDGVQIALVNTYREIIDAELARLYSYIGDLSLLEAKRIGSMRRSLDDIIEGEKEELNEHLYDVKNSPLWRWPKG